MRRFNASTHPPFLIVFISIIISNNSHTHSRTRPSTQCLSCECAAIVFACRYRRSEVQDSTRTTDCSTHPIALYPSTGRHPPLDIMDSLQNFVYRGQKPQRPQSMALPSPKRVTTVAGQRLDTILENGAPRNNAQQTARGPNWPLTNEAPHRTSQHGQPPRSSEEKRPPSYATQDSDVNRTPWPVTAREEKPPGAFRRMASKRGGWKRLALIILAIVAVLAIALGVGLGVGLSKRSSSPSSNDNPSSGTSTPSAPTGPFPVGAYAITTFLTNTSSACVSNPLTWTCYPYKTYSSAGSGSESPFNWLIYQDPSNSGQHLISSTNNSLSSIVFTNASLTLQDANTATERYTFSIPNMVKNVIPSASLSNDATLSTCFYNSTTFTGTLYTRKNATLENSTGGMQSMQSETTSDVIVFNTPWPGAVSVEQTIDAGSEVPNCYQLVNGRAGSERVNVPTQSSGQCSCLYMNYGNGKGGS